MRDVGDFIGAYRVLWKSDTIEASESYLVERSALPGAIYLLKLWSTISVPGDARQRIFTSQMTSLQRIQDPHILSLIDSGIDQYEHPYLVYREKTMLMKTLADRLQNGKFNEDEVRKILLETGIALTLAHQHNVIHGFFSAASVLFSDEGQLQVYSFLSSALDRGGAQTFSPDRYYYPEKEASRLSDQYALAVLARELLLTQGELSENASRTITRAQSSLPTERFQSIREFLHQLGIELPLAPDKKEIQGSSDQTEPQVRADLLGSTTEKDAGTTETPSQPGRIYRNNKTTSNPNRSSRRGCLIALVCILLIPLLIFLHSVLPASAATVNIAPVDQKFHQDYQLEEASETNIATNQFGGRALTYTPKTITKSGRVTNKIHIDGAPAKGKVVFSQITGVIDLDLYDLSIDVNDSVSLIVNDTTTIMEPGHTYTEPVYADTNGTKGDLAAGSVDGTYTFLQSGATAFISNPNSLKGGVNDYDGPIVTINDVNPAESNILKQQQQEAQTFFQAQLKPGEVLFANLGCKQTNTVNPPLDSRAGKFTVKSSAVCTVEAYDQEQFNTALADAAKKLAQQKFDTHIAATNPVKITITNSGIASITTRDVIGVHVDSEWRLLLDASGKKAMQQALSGLSQDDALALLRNHYKSRSTTLNLSWFWGGHMPTDSDAIQISARYLSS